MYTCIYTIYKVILRSEPLDDSGFFLQVRFQPFVGIEGSGNECRYLGWSPISDEPLYDCDSVAVAVQGTHYIIEWMTRLRRQPERNDREPDGIGGLGWN